MSEAIILYRGRGSSVDPELLKPKTITTNGIYEAPVTGTYRVSCVGGGGGGGGGCRNSWNSSQTFYGGGGERGYLNKMNISLNAGDKIEVSLGSGGAGGTNNITVVANNSYGSWGGQAGTTVFGIYVNAIGGYGGSRSWSYHTPYNTYTWNNTISGTKITAREDPNSWLQSCASVGIYGYDWRIIYGNGSIGQYYKNITRDLALNNGELVWTTIWSNVRVWNNGYINNTYYCYTSIQQGSWWYQNNNQVTTSGTRTYRGDGGPSGQAGNAGFILVVPPQV